MNLMIILLTYGVLLRVLSLRHQIKMNLLEVLILDGEMRYWIMQIGGNKLNKNLNVAEGF